MHQENTTRPTVTTCSKCGVAVYDWIEVQGSTVYLMRRHGIEPRQFKWLLDIPDAVVQAKAAWLKKLHAESDA